MKVFEIKECDHMCPGGGIPCPVLDEVNQGKRPLPAEIPGNCPLQNWPVFSKKDISTLAEQIMFLPPKSLMGYKENLEQKLESILRSFRVEIKGE